MFGFIGSIIYSVVDLIADKLGFVDRILLEETSEMLGRAQDTIEHKQNEMNRLISENSKLQNEIKLKNEALAYLPKRYARELGRPLEETPLMWMPEGLSTSVEIEEKVKTDLSFDMLRMSSNCVFGYDMILDPHMPVSEAGFVIDKMSKSIALAVQHDLAGKGMEKLALFLQEKDKKLCA